jgi:hypothetical protein
VPARHGRSGPFPDHAFGLEKKHIPPLKNVNARKRLLRGVFVSSLPCTRLLKKNASCPVPNFFGTHILRCLSCRIGAFAPIESLTPIILPASAK